MRTGLRTLILALAASLAGGCFVIEELDSGKASMTGSRKARQAEESAQEAEPSTRDGAGARASAVQAKVRDLWKNARTPTSQEPPNDPGAELVGCRIAGAVRFMSRTDCLTQGGQP